MKRLKTYTLALAVLLVIASLQPARAAEKKTDADSLVSYRVPYTITPANHIGVRVKLNGQGPHTFVMDTGAPGLTISPEMAQKLGIKPDADSWGVLPKLEIEGGPVLQNVKVYIVPGIEAVGGAIGYTVLAQFRIEFDYNRSRMIWTKKNWEPPRPATRRELGITEPPNFTPTPTPQPFGVAGGRTPLGGQQAYLGLGFDPSASPVRVTQVAEGSPAETAGIKEGDAVLEFSAQKIENVQQIFQRLGTLRPGEEVALKIQRGNETKDFKVTAGTRGGRGPTGGFPGMPGATPQPLRPVGYLGIQLDNAAPPATIAAVIEGSPAEKAGLRAGDVIIEFMQQPIQTPADIARISVRVRENEEVSLKIRRHTEELPITVKTTEGF